MCIVMVEDNLYFISRKNAYYYIKPRDITIKLNETFKDPGATASDNKDGDLTSKIIVKENTVKLDKIGTYKIVYQVTDKYGKIFHPLVKLIILFISTGILGFVFIEGFSFS